MIPHRTALVIRSLRAREKSSERGRARHEPRHRADVSLPPRAAARDDVQRSPDERRRAHSSSGWRSRARALALRDAVAALTTLLLATRLGARAVAVLLPNPAETFAFEEFDGAPQRGARLVDQTVDCGRRLLQSTAELTGASSAFPRFARHLVELRLHESDEEQATRQAAPTSGADARSTACSFLRRSLVRPHATMRQARLGGGALGRPGDHHRTSSAGGPRRSRLTPSAAVAERPIDRTMRSTASWLPTRSIRSDRERGCRS